MDKSDVCCVVACFFPDSQFEERMIALSKQVDTLMIVDNSEQSVLSKEFLTYIGQTNIHYENPGENKGLGFALNVGLNYAHSNQYEFLLTLDQDSLIDENLVQQLLIIYQISDPKVAIVGANFIDPYNGKNKYHVATDCHYKEMTTIQTSGNLVRVEHAISSGGYRESFFIDQIDHDICLRMKNHGFKVVVTRNAHMHHFAGENRMNSQWLSKKLPIHNPRRRYYIVRNSLILIRENIFKNSLWSMKRLLKVVGGIFYTTIFAEQRAANLKMSIHGIKHGLTGKLGEYKV